MINDVSVTNRLLELRDVIAKYDHQYYTLGKSEISDEEYDDLRDSNDQLEKDFPHLILKDSPNLRVGSSLDIGPTDGTDKAESGKITHPKPLLSLNKITKMTDLDRWYKKLPTEGPFYAPAIIMPKIDGLAVSLVYKKGMLTSAATRGDGKVGQDVTANVRSMNSIPACLCEEIDIEVRGEIFMDSESFDLLNGSLVGDDKYSNPRNAAAGALMAKDPAIAGKRNLSFLAYDSDYICSELSDRFFLLSKLGIPVVEFSHTTNPVVTLTNYSDVIDFKAQSPAFDGYRNSREYEVDGIVITCNDMELREKLGETSRAPRWAIAYKFPPKPAKTILKDIICQVGRTGKIAPVAILEPVEVGGAVVSRVTLHNDNYIKEYGIKVGDLVTVCRSGDVIPKIMKSETTDKSESSYEFPSVCPSCGSKLEVIGEHSFCTSEVMDCPEKRLQAFSHFVSRDCFNIDGLGERQLEKILNEYNFKNFSMLFEMLPVLKKDDHPDKHKIMKLCNWKELSVNNFIESVTSSRTVSLSRFIYSLGIPSMGLNNSERVANHYVSVDKFMEDMIFGFPSATNEDVLGSSALKDMSLYGLKYYDFVQKLLSHLSVTPMEVSAGSGCLKDLRFVITGSFEELKRSEIAALIKENGGSVSTGISSKIDFLVAGDKAGSKLDKAIKLDITVLSIYDLSDMMGRPIC